MMTTVLNIHERAALETIEGREGYLYLEKTDNEGALMVMELTETSDEYVFMVMGMYGHSIDYMKRFWEK